jgi:hypothetical protein
MSDDDGSAWVAVTIRIGLALELRERRWGHAIFSEQLTRNIEFQNDGTIRVLERTDVSEDHSLDPALGRRKAASH